MSEVKKTVSVGIVTWNSAADMPGCIEGLSRQSYPVSEIIIVDNASSDDSLIMARAGFPQATIIENDHNAGYCAAHNLAISRSSGDYYLALNPDVQMAPDFIGSLVEALEHHPECGSAVGKFWLPGQDGSRLLDAAGLGIDRSRHQYLRGHAEPDQGQFDQAGDVFGADGAAPLHRRAMLEEVRIFDEYFDEQFFAYMEDVDLAWRAKLLGWKCWYEPNAMAVHDRSFKPGLRATMSKALRRMAVRNRYLTILKNESKQGYRRDWWRIHLYDLQIAAFILLFERSSLAAYALLRRQWSQTKDLRKEIWSRAKVSGEETLSWFD
jgi:GT2 family glycosyltransferase